MKLNQNVRYLSFIREDGNYTAQYAEYALSGVLVREKWAMEPEGTDDGETAVYYFPNRSLCRDPLGNETLLPRAKYGDCVRLTAPDGSVRTLRVRQASYCDGGSLGLSHVRLDLK